MLKSNILIVIIVSSFIFSCIYEDERLKFQNDTIKKFDQNIPCWVIYPPKNCPEYKNSSRFEFFSSELKLSEKIYDSTAENDLKIKIASQLFSMIACRIESAYDKFKSCQYHKDEIICKTKSNRIFNITTEGIIGLGHIHIIKTYWKKNNNDWILFGLGRLSKKYTETRFFY
ncbi:hypothetical protein MHK_004329 [Candidatus Magnetomorum sp. HK-1]|nr:hypothetical protein MHK_004329 [Candidatus Magnetomorum sp. HK-1]